MNTETRPARNRLFCEQLCCLALTFLAGCTGEMLLYGALPPPKTSVNSPTSTTLAIGIVIPATPTTAAPGAAAIVQWADIATIAGTSVRIIAQRENSLGESTSDPIHLVGDGTVGSGRDALADGDGDRVEWDITGVRVGDYVITAIIESPDGETATAISRDTDRGTTGVLTVTTSLPVPTFTFTAPGATDVTVTTGNTFNITWTDNGNNNADARLTLGLDLDDDHDNGNEVILLSNDPLSNNGNTGTFTFSFLDQDGTTVPDGSYSVFAVVDDNANDPVERTATGRLILNP
ncbi:MAG: hypothetical protein AMXMBFR20_28290 [Planctomycetia bacterium]